MAAAGKRTNEAAGGKISEAGKLAADFSPQKDPPYIDKRLEVWKKLYAEQLGKQEAAKANTKPISITLKDGSIKDGMAFQTTPMDVASGISKGLAKEAVVALVTYEDGVVVTDDLTSDPMDMDDEAAQVHGAEDSAKKQMQWDMTRPLEGSCKLELVTFTDNGGSEVYWHSSAHMLGAALEKLYGGYLGVGPPLDNGFYYDVYVGSKKLAPEDFQEIEKEVLELSKRAAPFERLVLSKEDALELFADNPFKVQLINAKIPDGAQTSAYRCGPLIDLCRGPHVPSTDRIKHIMCTRNSSAYWLGKATNDSMQRVYGITFPTEKRLKEYKLMIEEAKKRDHRNVGLQQELFFFHPVVSPGSCFWNPMGAIIYNTLVDFIRNEYRIRKFQEVITPNIFAAPLFQTSGHYQNYKEEMYGFDCEGQEWFLKPMNCPAHCMLFDHRVRSYKELPMRVGDFGALHRNEKSGALAGLTRVRRFQQDDGHIFCRPEQIKQEVLGALDFLKYVYNQFGFNFTVALSTKPEKAMGEQALWDEAEAAMKEVLIESGLEWSLNPGDGAFYGPKIDTRLTDAMGRQHQCGTIQLDFQLPIRFNLQYRTDEVESKASAEAEPTKPEDATEAPSETDVQQDAGKKGDLAFKEQKVKPGFKRPVIIHRAVLGSVERFVAILTEHFGGKWPFWLNPRQILVIPVSHKFDEYGEYVAEQLSAFGFQSAVDTSSATLDKKVRNAQLAQWSYMGVVGEKEEESLSVALRSREGKGTIGVFGLQDLVEMLKAEGMPSSKPVNVITPYKGRCTEARVAGA